MSSCIPRAREGFEPDEPKECHMKVKVIIHEVEEGGYWAEVPAIPGCATQGDSFEELLANLHEAVEACLSVDIDEEVLRSDNGTRVMEIAM
jgi:predicted RNase H-like HicB family nuclease